jgi:uncharacterized protein (DUF697 family)
MSDMNHKYKGIVRTAVVAASASGAIPFTDVAIMSGIWGTMIVSIAARSGHPLSKGHAVKLAAAVLTGIGTFKFGTKVFTTILHLFPGIGTITAIGIDSFINAFQTYRFGKKLAKQFDNSNFDGEQFMEFSGQLIETVLDVRPDHVWEDAWDALACITGN